MATKEGAAVTYYVHYLTRDTGRWRSFGRVPSGCGGFRFEDVRAANALADTLIGPVGDAATVEVVEELRTRKVIRQETRESEG